MAKNNTKRTSTKNVETQTVAQTESVDKITSITDAHSTGEVVMKDAFGCKVYTIY